MNFFKSNIKIIRLVIIVLIIGTAVVYFTKKADASPQKGIFMTWQDYKQNEIKPAEKINLNHLSSSRYVDIIEEGKKYRYCKDSIFGYRDADGKDYRFFKIYNDEYQILENLDMVIYVIYNPTHTSKGISQPLTPDYYFSKALNSDVLPLTILNFKSVYPDNLKFHDLLDREFGNGLPLSFYDNANKMFRVNYILKQSL